MADLEFLGWRLKPGAAGSDGAQYYAPPYPDAWGDRQLWVRGGLLTIDQQISLTVRGLVVELETSAPGLPVTNLGGVLRPGKAANRLFVRMGGGGARRTHRFAVGPAVFHDASWPAYEFGPGGVLRIDLQASSTLVGDGTGGRPSPLLIQGGGGRYVLDLAAGTATLEPAALAAELRVFAQASRTLRTVWRNKPASIPFAAIANRAASNLQIEFEAVDPGRGAPLNAAAQSPTPLVGVEAFDCDLRVTLGRSATAAPARVVSAGLKPGPQGRVRLRFHGVWNSRNEPEEWAYPAEVPLAFRMGGQDWSSALVASGDLPGLQRLEGKTPSGKVLPIHGLAPGAQVILADGATATLVTSDLTAGTAELDAADPNLEWRDPGLRRWTTRPWLRFSDARFHHPRPGEAYIGETPLVFVRGTSAGGLPALPRSVWSQGARVAVGNEEVDAAFRGMVLDTLAGHHESGLSDHSDQKPKIRTVLPAAAALAPVTPAAAAAAAAKTKDPQEPWQAGALVLEAHPRKIAVGAMGTDTQVQIDLGLKVPVQRRAFEYAVCWPSHNLGGVATFDDAGWAEQFVGRTDPTAPIRVGKPSQDANRPDTLPLGLLKLGRERTLEAILTEVGARAGAGTGYTDALGRLVAIIREVNPSILLPTWVGLLATEMPLDFSEFAVLQQTIPLAGTDAPRLQFLAASPRVTGAGGGAPQVAISAAVNWRSPQGDDDPDHPAKGTDYSKAQPESEVGFWPTRLDIRFRDSALTAFSSESMVEFRSLLGVGHGYRDGGEIQKKNKRIRILGSVRRTDPQDPHSPLEFRFAADAKDPIRVYPISDGPPEAEKQSFIEGAWFRRLEMVDAPAPAGSTDRSASLRIDGDLALRKPQGVSLPGDFLSKIQGRLVSFKNLGIDLTGVASLSPRLLQISYPSLKFDLDLPQLELFAKALRLKLHALALSWSGGFDFPGFITLPGLGAGWDASKPNIFFLGRIDFGGLPSLFARGLSGFALELGLGLNFEKDNAKLTGGRTLVIRGFGFDGLNFDLMSFVTLSVGHLELGAYPPSTAPNAGAEGAHLELKDVRLAILGREIFKKASGGFFSLKDGGGDGFWAYFPPDPDHKLLAFDWGFVGLNIDFSAEIAKTLLVPPPTNEPEDVADSARAQGEKLAGAWDAGDIRPATSSGGRGWTFAAGMTLLDGALVGRALIQDSGFAGLSIWGPKLKEWFGYDFSFCGIYRQNITPGEDYFYISTTLGGATVGDVRFTGGGIAVEVYTSGSFLVDFGFPWQGPDGGRLWKRTIGAIITPGQASAGFYLRKHESAGMDPATKVLTLSAGFALQWGLGVAYAEPGFSVWARIGVYGVLEGSADLLVGGGGMALQSLTVVGAGGVLAEGEGALNWWIISVSVYVCASAEVRLLLDWKAGGPTHIDVTAELYVSAHAEACVGGGCFKICRGITIGLHIPVTYSLTFS